MIGSLPATPEVTDVVKHIYDDLTPEARANSNSHALRQWLTYNSTYFRDDLLRAARRVKDESDYVSNENQSALLSLARLDWDSALPVVQRLEADTSQPYSQTLAKWVRYRHALDQGDLTAVDDMRSQLQRIVEDRTAPWAQRDLAMDSLVSGGPWAGRDDWYMSLFQDETLLQIQEHGYTGMTTLLSATEPGAWTDRMLKLLESDNATVRTVAAR